MQEEKIHYLESICHSLSKASNLPVRLFHHNDCLYYYSVYHLYPDPVILLGNQLLTCEHPAGIITTPLYQFYGYLTFEDNWRIVIGPTKMQEHSIRPINEFLFQLNISSELKDYYLHVLRCMPIMTAEQMGWLLALIFEIVEKQKFSFDKLYTNVRPFEHQSEIQKKYTKQHVEECISTEDTTPLLYNGFEFEKIILFYIEHGKPEKLKEILLTPPQYLTGHLSNDIIRHSKNLNICCATIACRAAVAGGVENLIAFRMSDLYIQKTELLEDNPSLIRLRNEMFIDFAKEVEKVRYHILTSTKDTRLFRNCADYISKHIFSSIRTDELATALGYTRSYLCNNFKLQTGMTLTQYIQQEKIFDSKRMLQFTNKSLSEIAMLYSFSSQSHFQNVFKKITGETPAAYRQRMQQ